MVEEKRQRYPVIEKVLTANMPKEENPWIAKVSSASAPKEKKQSPK